MKYLLDANSIIQLLAGRHPALTARVAMTPAGDLAISSIAYAEVAMGRQGGKPQELALLAAFVEEVPVLPFDQAAADVYATLPFRRGSYDRLIAAHAVSLGMGVITRNIRDFADVSGLVAEDWTIEP